MAWITPKTDWESTDSVTYIDYNRIKNNLLYINNYLNEIDPDTAQTLDLGDDKNYGSRYLPSEFNAFEEALESFTRVGDDVNVGTRSYYRDNGNFITASQLIRLESCCLNWFNYPVIESAEIIPPTFSLDIEQTMQLTLNVYPSKATYSVVWTSSDTSIATISENGLVTAVASGTVTITATVTQGENVITATAECEVNSVVTSLTLSTNTIKNAKGYETYVTVYIVPANASNADNYEITFDSDKRICAVEKDNVGNLRRFKVTITGDVFDYYGTTRNLWELQEAESQIGGVVVMPKNTLTVSLGDCSATLDVQSIISGSYAVPLDTTNRYMYYSFEVIGQQKDGSNVSTLIGYHYDFVKGSMLAPDNSANYRTVVQNFINHNFSNNLRNALLSVSKEVMTGTSSKGSKSEKFFLPAVNEIADSNKYSSLVSDSTFKVLGSVFYEFFAHNNVTRNASMAVTRNTLYSSQHGYESVYWDENRDVSVGYETSYLQPLFFLDKNTKVIKLDSQVAKPAEGDIYYIDWTGESSVTLGSLPLGSVIIDKTGTGRTG